MSHSSSHSHITIPVEGGELELTSSGLTCPRTLLVEKQRVELEKHGLTEITIGWDSIAHWNAVSFPYYREIVWRWFYYLFSFRNWLDVYDWYEIGLKSYLPLLGDTRLLIRRVSLRASEKLIIDFAQPYIAFTLAPMRVTVTRSWPLILAAAFAILILIMSMSKCNLLDFDCMNSHKLF
jgi:hypothetical protein